MLSKDRGQPGECPDRYSVLSDILVHFIAIGKNLNQDVLISLTRKPVRDHTLGYFTSVRADVWQDLSQVRGKCCLVCPKIDQAEQ